MKGYEDFLNDLKNNEKLQKKVEEAQIPKDACDMLKKEGYSVTEDEFTEFYLENVSGGAFDRTETTGNQSVSTNLNGNYNVVSINQSLDMGNKNGCDANQIAGILASALKNLFG